MTVAREREQRLLASIARDVADVLASIATLREATVEVFAGADAAGRPVDRAALATLHPLIARLLRRHEGFAAGAGVVLAPDVLADAPRWIEWWWADRGSGIERLAVDHDPDSVDFYDYTAAEWYSEPERTRQQSITGPYVDYICTHEYTYTLAIPLIYGERFVGVAGADILAQQVERAVVPELMQLEHVAVLASGNGRIIASNTVLYPPGNVLARHEASHELLPVAGHGAADDPVAGISLPWTLLAGGEVDSIRGR